jgi:retron-type reverse transcriptase
VQQAQHNQTAGSRWVVDLDLEKFFDRANHDRLLAKIAERVSDKRLVKLMRAFLHVMENGLFPRRHRHQERGGRPPLFAT